MEIMIWGALLLAGLIVFAFLTGTRQTDESLKLEEQQARDGMDADLYRELKELLSRKKKIEAIRRLREKTGVGLYAAKQVIDGL